MTTAPRWRCSLETQQITTMPSKGFRCRTLRDLVLQARINWEVQWSEVPAASKAQLYAVARERHPYLARFTNDWATEEIVKQYIKNKRRHAYKNGWLEPPPNSSTEGQFREAKPVCTARQEEQAMPKIGEQEVHRCQSEGEGEEGGRRQRRGRRRWERELSYLLLSLEPSRRAACGVAWWPNSFPGLFPSLDEFILYCAHLCGVNTTCVHVNFNLFPVDNQPGIVCKIQPV
ncbi:hypothetical protein B0H13DRAFT_2064625 [Mycena leptocephala]|nr:hypothetical protein B0H13DRAFT_2064625 [Mycena leptocephala]